MGAWHVRRIDISNLHAHDEHYYKISWIFLIFFIKLPRQSTGRSHPRAPLCDSMKIYRSTAPLSWGDLSLPLWGLTHDLTGHCLLSPLMFSLAFDAERLWFVAAGKTPAQIHPQARPGKFVAELWQFDCVELFIADARSGRYLEFNLAANGSWWSAEFIGPRQRAEVQDVAFPEVATFAELSPEGGWLSAMAIPLDLLQARIDWSRESFVNVTAIVETPQQRFVSANPLPGDCPDFHQPQHFSRVEWIDDVTTQP